MDSHKFNRLLQKIKEDKEAIGQIYNEYYANMVLHLQRRFGNQISAEDVAHDTFISLMLLENIPVVQYPNTWILKVADHKAIDKLRRKKVTLALPDDIPTPSFVDDLMSKEDLRKSFEELDPQSKTILIMHHFEGYSHKEIADYLNLTCANVRTKASRAYAKIKVFLRKM